ncbi:hypothetical protein AYR62_02925 [Secundilactobacillus paracollinoides]|uniref:hypothetical protein n=1 Tax=Secundilactobacillus paracollinoides TaxID=240427 RepID=UPI0006D1A630|nr:hypothetical protein [Secundilactobacillus paracollinoides]ANZ63152.1 hypothetical protein AYR62_02925 [Secundilactobacillus paracollinoides]KRL75446.1 hypothetical protein FC17_GL002632 [Secundilactobacillus paracollinoides DSM 15502 = JCM 11969]
MIAAMIDGHALQMAIRVVLYLVIGTAVLVLRYHNRKKARKRQDERTKRMMRHATRDENGKYPWER